MNYLTRTIENIIKKAVKQFPAIILTGPRQSGKTTLLKQLYGKEYEYVTFDDPDVVSLAKSDPKLFFENFKAPIIIDEVQYVPEILPIIKIYIDNNRKQNGQFILTGSQSFPLMANVSESLAGRIAVFTLLSFSIKEQLTIHKKLNLATIKKITLAGGFPELAVNNKTDRKIWLASYLRTYLERDVRMLRQIGDLTDFQRFLDLIGSINGQVLQLSNLSRDLGVAVNTVKAWISILEASHQIILIKPLYLNKGKRIVKAPKVYFLDTGLLCYINGIDNTSQVFKGMGSGQLFENVVLCEIVRRYYNLGERPKIHWWRTSNGLEVDFVIEMKNKLIPIEVKMTTKANANLIKNLSTFCELYQKEVTKGYLINQGERKLKLSDKITAVPFADFVKGEIF